MADTRFNYDIESNLGKPLAESVRCFGEALFRMEQWSTTSGAVETDAELAAVIGLTTAEVTTLRSIYNGCLASMQAWKAAMARLDKCL